MCLWKSRGQKKEWRKIWELFQRVAFGSGSVKETFPTEGIVELLNVAMEKCPTIHSLMEMPLEIVFLIIKRVSDVKDIIRLSLVCHHMKALCDDPTIWNQLCQINDVLPHPPDYLKCVFLPSPPLSISPSSSLRSFNPPRFLHFGVLPFSVICCPPLLLPVNDNSNSIYIWGINSFLTISNFPSFIFQKWWRWYPLRCEVRWLEKPFQGLVHQQGQASLHWCNKGSSKERHLAICMDACLSVLLSYW